MLAEFPSVVVWVQCAVDIPRAMVKRSADVWEDRRVGLRVGISPGDMIIDGDDIR